MKRKHLWYSILIICALSLLVSCGPSGGGDDGNGGGGGTGTGNSASIALSVDKAAIPADGTSSAAITATLLDGSGQAVPSGTSVTFSTTLGTFPNGSTSHTVTTLDDSGSITISLIAATTPGPAQVTCTSNAVTQSIKVIFAADAAKITLTVDSGSIPADGASSLAITATIHDTSDQPVLSGTSVAFSTTRGTFSNGLKDCTVITPDETGKVTVSLIAGTTMGFVDITCVSSGVSQSVTVVFTGQGPVGETAMIKLTADPTSIPADGAGSLAITATLFDSSGQAVLQGTSATFSTTLGSFPNSAAMYTVQVPDETGKVTVSLIAGTTIGFADVVCTSNGVSQSVTVVFTGQGPVGETAMIKLIADPDSIPADGVSSLAIAAMLLDGSGQPVPSGTSATFSTTRGSFPNGAASYTVATLDDGGIVTVSLIAGTTIGFADVTCLSNGVTQLVTVVFTGQGPVGETAMIKLIADPDSIPADGVSSLAIIAMLLDGSGEPVPSGTSATFSTTRGSFPNGATSYTVATLDDWGAVMVSLIAGTTIGFADVTCLSNGVTQLVTVVFTGQGPVGETAMIKLTADPDSIPADGVSSSAITATLKDATGQAVSKGTSITFTTTLGTFPGGVTSYSVTTFDDTGVVTVSLIAGTTAGTANVTAESNNITQLITVELKKEIIPIPVFLSLGLSQTTVKSDNSDSSTITARVLDENYAVIEGITVTFSADGGQISSSTVVTDANGMAQITFSSGTADRSNRVVTITATVAGLDPKQIPVQVIGTTIELDTDKTNLEIGGDDTATLTITVKDAGLNPIFDTPVTISVDPSSTGAATLSPSTGNTDVNGKLEVEVTGTGSGNVTVNVEASGATAAQTYTVGETGDVFGIIEPTEDPCPLATNTDLTIKVKAPDHNDVVFATTFGAWDGTIDMVVIKTRDGSKEASAILRSTYAGIATIQVYYKDDPSIMDSMTVAVSAPSSEAAKIALQASATVVAPSTGDTTNTVTLIARVRNASDQVVGGAAVAFSIENPTGGGESVFPVTVLTDNYGVATTTFTSGSLSSDAGGVTVKAVVVGMPTVTDSISIVIGGTAGSIIIGQGTTVTSVNNDTAYQLPMSVLVADSNGNSVPGVEVSLSAWPNRYGTGYWKEGPPDECEPEYTGKFPNEDINRNLILDPGEDVNEDGQLTPPNSAAGSLPGTVTTDQNGVANFNLVYLKASAAWIEDEITATTLVLGTETRSTYTFWLPWLEGEECHLPHSPYTFPWQMALEAVPDTLPNDGLSTSSITAKVTRVVGGTPIYDGEVINFWVSTGEGTLSENSATTTGGTACVDYTASTAPGTAMITAQAFHGLYNTVNIPVYTFPAVIVKVEANPDEIPADGSSTSIITATVTDAYGVAIPDGVDISFSVTAGGGILSALSAPTTHGVATVIYTADTTSVTVTITATGPDGKSHKVDITLTP